MLLNASNRFNIWDKVFLNQPLKVARGDKVQTLPAGSKGFVIQANPLVVELYGIKDTVELPEKYLTKEQ